MKMSANENESVDIRLYSNRRSDLDVELEEINRMERPSRVFSSRHHLSIPPVLTDTNNMELINEQYRRSREYLNSSYFETMNNYSRNGGSASNGDTMRNRLSPYVRFTITDPETQQITAAGQIPLNSPPLSTQANTSTSNNTESSTEIADVPIGELSDDEHIDYRRHYFEQRRLTDQLSAMVHVEQQLRNNRPAVARRSRRFTEHPFYVRNNLDNNPQSVGRILNRRSVRVSSTNRGYNDHIPDRSQTPEQELPEVLAQEMEPENQEYEEVYHGQESMSSMLSRNDADSDDQRSTNFSITDNLNANVDEENQETLDLSNEIPRTRVVPFIMSPIPLSPQTDTPPELLEIPTTINNNVSTTLSLLNIEGENLSTTLPLRNLDGSIISPLTGQTTPFRYVVRSDVYNGTVNRVVDRVVDVELNNTVNNPAHDINSNEVINEAFGVINDNNNQLDSSSSQVVYYESVPRREDQSRATEETPAHIEEHPETYEDLNEQLTRLFECPVCFEHIIPPIYQCLLGHLICNKCVLMCANCPSCRNPFNSKRNLYMEKVGYLVKFPCKNVLTGCKQRMFITQKEIHEQECCYRHYQCFFTNCTWKGYLPELHVHVNSIHPSLVVTGPNQSLDVILPSFNQTFKWFVEAHNEYFAIIAHATAIPRRVKIQVNCIGPAPKAKQFKFTIILSQPKDNGDRSQRLIYERSTLPYSEIFEITNLSSVKKDIFSFPGDVLEPFILKNRRRLPIVIKIEPVSSS